MDDQAAETTSDAVEDRRGRRLRDLRVSVTDRCNLRCPYCMPREVFGPDFAFLDRSELLDFDEITRVVRAAASLGVRKVRLTGGEPLLRRDLATLVGMISGVEGVDDIALTTNGVLLDRHAARLADAGLNRVTVSLDALDHDTFRRMSDSGQPLDRVLGGLTAADDAGLSPVKINTVVVRGVNEDQLLPLAQLAREQGHVVRFIEYMDVGSTNGWILDDVVPADEIVRRITSVFAADPVPPNTPGEVATRYRYRDGRGEFGIIASVTRPFCGDCVRARLSPIGELFTCLFSSAGHDLRAVLRSGADDTQLIEVLATVWHRRDDRYSELRAKTGGPDGRVEMSYIGG